MVFIGHLFAHAERCSLQLVVRICPRWMSYCSCRNPKQPPVMYQKPLKSWDIHPPSAVKNAKISSNHPSLHVAIAPQLQMRSKSWDWWLLAFHDSSLLWTEQSFPPISAVVWPGDEIVSPKNSYCHVQLAGKVWLFHQLFKRPRNKQVNFCECLAFVLIFSSASHGYHTQHLMLRTLHSKVHFFPSPTSNLTDLNHL